MSTNTETALIESLGYLVKHGRVTVAKANGCYSVEFTLYHDVELTYLTFSGYDKELSKAVSQLVANFLKFVRLIRDRDY